MGRTVDTTGASAAQGLDVTGATGAAMLLEVTD
jgi:hypothetical protein